jgi:hypothetical protein
VVGSRSAPVGSGYKDGIVELSNAFNNQTHGDESRNPKIDLYGRAKIDLLQARLIGAT